VQSHCDWQSQTRELCESGALAVDRCKLAGMGGRTGGGGAASGLFYQYLFTIEKFLALLADGSPADTEVRIEDPEDPDVLDPDIVDFSVYSSDGVAQEFHQVKSVAAPEKSTISAGDALVTLVRMTAKDVAWSVKLSSGAARSCRPRGSLDGLASDELFAIPATRTASVYVENSTAREN
jgi:hypothetical protein